MNVTRVIRLAIALLATLLLAACAGRTLNGSYTPDGEQSYTYDKLTFSPDGTMVAVFTGAPIAPAQYAVSGNHVAMRWKDGTERGLDIRTDGCLAGSRNQSMHGVYCKEKP